MKYNKNILEAFEEGEFKFLLHQTNCISGRNVAGIASAIFNKYPLAADVHKHSQFGTMEIVQCTEGYVVNCNSQYFPGQCSDRTFRYNEWDIVDNFNNRLVALIRNLRILSKKGIIGIPLVGSGLGADLKLKGTMSDLEYFVNYIEPHVPENVKVYYL